MSNRTIKPSEILMIQKHHDFLPKLSKEELKNLRDSIIAEGKAMDPQQPGRVIDPIKLIKGSKMLLDGHNRVTIAKSLKMKDIPYEVVDLDGGDALEWILRNQLSRRNLPELYRDKLLAQFLKKGLKKVAEVAKEEKLSPMTIKRIVKQQAEIEALPEAEKEKVEATGTRRGAVAELKKINPASESTIIKNHLWQFKQAFVHLLDELENLEETSCKLPLRERAGKVVNYKELPKLILYLEEQFKLIKK